MGLTRHAALENGLIMRFIDYRPWNAPLLVFCQLLDMGKMLFFFFIESSIQEFVTALLV